VLVRELRQIQERCGYLPRPELETLSARLAVPLHRLHEVATFFPHFHLEPPPEVEVLVCRDQACHLRGAGQCARDLKAIAAEFGDGRVSVEGVSCLGRCDGAPAALVELHRPGRPDQARVLQTPAVDDYAARLRMIASAHLGDREVPADPLDRSPRRWEIDPYHEFRNNDGHVSVPPDFDETRSLFQAARLFAQALRQARSSDERRDAGEKLIIAPLKAAELRGMGGAGVPAFRKWADVRDARGDEKYIVCNADESEPATFKDREILLRAPEVVIEGIVLAALLVQARHGYIYLRHEYHDQARVLGEALAAARSNGILGRDSLSTSQPFELEVFESPGGYVCGEQGALIEAIEERRAEPRNRPPQLETNGLFDKPTLLSNVETFAWVPAIVLRGGQWYAGAGRTESQWYQNKGKPGGKGLRLLSICGDVARPGVYEVQIGSSLGELIDSAGGVRGGLALKAVAPSGPSGGFIPAFLTRNDIPLEFHRNFPAGIERLDIRTLPLDLDEFRSLGLMLGAGITVYAQSAGLSILDQALNATQFFRNESCGKCVPCRIGSQKLVEIAERIAAAPPGVEQLAREQATVDDLLRTLELTSICGLGMSAAKPLATALGSFGQDVVKQA
jgi:NADH:ubiquinone oxidoreductase subunit F (NADH-binding)/NADH:ubiquinone oxidoreductase subunit E